MSFVGVNLTYVRGALKICSVSLNNAASLKSRLHIHEMQRNVTKNYRKLTVNKFYDSVLLPDGCVYFEVRGKGADTNCDLAGCSQQLLRFTVHV